jgi:hypothetical protein
MKKMKEMKIMKEMKKRKTAGLPHKTNPTLGGQVKGYEINNLSWFLRLKI